MSQHQEDITAAVEIDISVTQDEDLENPQGGNVADEDLLEYPGDDSVLFESVKSQINARNDLITVINQLQTHEEKKLFINQIWTKLKKMFPENELKKRGKSTKNAKIPEFFSGLNDFLTGMDYKNICKVIFPDFTTSENMVCTKTVLAILDKLIDMSMPLEDSIQPQQYDGDIPDAVRSKIRYIAGNCIFKVKQDIKDFISRQFSQQGKKSQVIKENIKRDLLKKLEIPEADLFSSTSDVASLSETYEKQGLRRGLTNVSDAANIFFIKLFLETNKNLSVDMLKKHGENFCQVVMNNVQQDDLLMDVWFKLFEHEGEDMNDLHVVMILDIFHKVSEQYVKVNTSDFIKKFRTDQRNKSTSLRTTIKKKEGEKKTVKDIPNQEKKGGKNTSKGKKGTKTKAKESLC